MFKLFILLAASSFIWLFNPLKIQASDFYTTIKSTYTISQEGLANVTLNLSLENKSADTFAHEYRLQFGSDRLKNIRATTATGIALNPNIQTSYHQTIIDVTFTDPTVGKGKINSFNIQYTDPDAAQNIGSVLEIMVPKLEDAVNVDSYEVTLLVPLEFGAPAIISPESHQLSVDPAFTKLVFSSNNLSTQGITAIFGDRQIFSLNLIYELDNSTITPLETQIALPPDTPFQKLYYQNISPPPQNIHLDTDGNWIADYTLEAKASQEVRVNANLITYLKPIVPVPPPTATLSTYLTTQKYWSTTDGIIQSLKPKLTTPKLIYQYLVDNFKYDTTRVDNRSTARLGATAALTDPDHNLCLEFADAFIALARAQGIPARLLVGYAYSENTSLRPLSLVSDVLHAWPEYFDPSTSTWHPIDPTWGNTSGGLDYFTSLDFNHLVFAIQGSSSDRPFPAGYYQNHQTNAKDVDVSLSQFVPDTVLSLSTHLTLPLLTQLFMSHQVVVSFTNQSGFALYNEPVSLVGTNLDIIKPNSPKIPVLLPYQNYQLPITFKDTYATTPKLIQLELQSYRQTLEIKRFESFRLTPIVFLAAAFILVFVAVFLAFFTRRLLVFKRAKTTPLHR
jgi:transglutaminase-like putative cysteine protease